MRILLRCTVLVGVVSCLGCGRGEVERESATALAPTPTAFNTTGAPTVEFAVPDMMCAEGCGVKVKEVLSEQRGVKDVLVDFDDKTAKVAVDGDAFDSNEALAALVDHSFTNSAIKSDPLTSPAAADGTAKP